MRTSLLVCVVVALFGCKESAPAAPRAVAKAPVVAAPAPAPIEGAIAFPFTQAESNLSWVARRVKMSHDGAFTVFGGIIEVVGGEVTKSRVRAEIDMNSVTTTPEKLVGHLKSADFFSVPEFPTAQFISTSIAKTEAGYAVTGNLTLHGVTKAITFPASITVTDAEVTVLADFAINRKDFGIIYPGKPDDLIADDVALKLELHAKKRT